METKELDNLNRGELFKELKSKCKSRTKIGLYGWLALLFLLLLLVFLEVSISFKLFKNLQHREITLYIEEVLFICAFCWYSLNNYRFLRKIDGLDSPDQLLHFYEKKLKNERGPFFLFQFGLLCYIIDGLSFLDIFQLHKPWIGLLMILVVIVLFALVIYRYKNVEKYYSSRAVEIIEQLKELTEKK